MADVWNWIPERSVGRWKEDLSIDTTFDPPEISLDSPFKERALLFDYPIYSIFFKTQKPEYFTIYSIIRWRDDEMYL